VSTLTTGRRRKPSHLAVVGLEPTRAPSTAYPVNVIACWSGVGSPGRTTVAINIAAELALAGEKVLLIDLDTLGPAISLSLGLVDTPAGLSAALRLVEQGRFSASEFERLSVAIDLGRSELLFLPGLSSATRWQEVTAERLSALLASVAQYVDHVVLDLAQPTFSVSSRNHPSTMNSSCRDELLADVLVRADKLVVISGCDPVAAKRFLDAQSYLTEVGRTADQYLAVNRFRTSTLGSDAKHEISQSYENLVKLRVDCFIPDDPENLDRAMRNGLPLALLKRSSPARIAINELAKQILISSAKRVSRG